MEKAIVPSLAPTKGPAIEGELITKLLSGHNEWTMVKRTLEKAKVEKPLGMFRRTLEKCDGQTQYPSFCGYKYQGQ